MRQASVLVQISLLFAGTLLVYLYIYPELIRVNENQDLIQKYNEAIEEGDDLRSHIQRLQQRADAMPTSDLLALERYLPTTPIDEIMVQRDIQALVRARSLTLINLSAGESDAVEDEETLKKVDFSVSVRGTYENIKAFIADIERNNYPLRLVEMKFSPAGTAVETEMVLETYYFVGLSD